MKTTRLLISILAATILIILCANQVQAQDGPSSIFTYQGRLVFSNQPVNDTCSFRFSLWDALTDGHRVGDVFDASNVSVEDGAFTVALNFGMTPFTGQALWLAVGVDCGEGTVELSPRQAITAAPYAITAFTLQGLQAEDFWKLGGNSSTTPGADFVGTTDAQALELHVDSTRVLRLEPANGIGNVIAGAPQNSVVDGAYGGVIGGGGGTLGLENTVFDNYGTVCGGAGNWVGNIYENMDGSSYATVVGGRENSARAMFATVGGGDTNIAEGVGSFIGGGNTNNAEGSGSVIAGGSANHARGNSTTVGGGSGNVSYGDSATVSGGQSNSASSNNAVVGGGSHNVAGVWGEDPQNNEDATVAGGNDNQALASASTVGGGVSNRATGFYATVSGGWHNQALADFATIGGGGTIDPITDPESSSNQVYDAYGVIAGGGDNLVGLADGDQFAQKFATIGGGESNGATGAHATIAGGNGNWASGVAGAVGGGRGNGVSGVYATAPGGRSNRAEGDYSFAAGRSAQAQHDGAFVWADSNSESFASTRDNQFRVHADGGVEFETGQEGLRVSADSILYLSPHDIVIRGSSGTTLRPLDNGGMRVQIDPDAQTKYISAPFSTYGILFGSTVYVKTLRVCYRTNTAAVAYITRTAVAKNNGGTGAVYYINNGTDHSNTSHTCYTVAASTPRKPIDNSSWVQFNIVPGQTGDYVDILTVALTLTEYP